MKVRVPEQNQGAEELERLFSAKLQESAQTGFILGGHTALKLAADAYGEKIRAAKTKSELRQLSLELLAYMEERSDGLKGILDKNGAA